MVSRTGHAYRRAEAYNGRIRVRGQLLPAELPAAAAASN